MLGFVLMSIDFYLSKQNIGNFDISTPFLKLKTCATYNFKCTFIALKSVFPKMKIELCKVSKAFTHCLKYNS